MTSKLPLIVITGATGTGKTKLSLELAKKFGGEIIGADSMQLYKSLDIATAKATKEEQSVAPHHMIDILDPHEIYTVLEYRNRVVKLIDNLIENNKLPIVVGGTNYYVESILWNILIESSNVEPCTNTFTLLNNEHELPSEKLHDKLKLLDPAMARRLHPNNKRKIMRALEIIQLKGKKPSDLLAEQQSSKGGSKTGGGLRYKNSLVLWLQCEKEVLNQRLNERVDSMLKAGLLQELMYFHKEYNEQRLQNSSTPDYTKGVFQAIGFKEFNDYLFLSDEEKTSQLGEAKLAEGIKQLQMVTRRYANKQNRWVKNRFLGRTDREVPPVYGLDTTYIDKWDENVLIPASEIVQSAINNILCAHKPLPVQPTNSSPNADDDTYTCDVCNRIFVGAFQWNFHIKSNKHKRQLERLKRKGKLPN